MAATEPDFESDEPTLAATEPDFEPDTTDAPEISDSDEQEDINSADPERSDDSIAAPSLGISSGARVPWMRTAGWSSLGVGLAALGGALSTSILSSSKANDANKLDPALPGYDKKFDDLKQQTETHALVSNILYPVGAALTVTGLVFLILDTNKGVKVGDKGSMEIGADVDLNKFMLQTTVRF